MKDSIALALIQRLVANGVLDAGDVSEICIQLSDRDANAVKAAWITGLAGPDDAAPRLTIISGGK